VVPSDEWARCRPWIEAALEYCYGTHRIEDIEAGLARGQYAFWPGRACAIVTEFTEYPQFKALNFFLVGGDRDELWEMEPHICAWAKAHGCTKVSQIGRSGWSKDFKARGYTVALLVASQKEL
jgi:hypothetical protein